MKLEVSGTRSKDPDGMFTIRATGEDGRPVDTNVSVSVTYRTGEQARPARSVQRAFSTGPDGEVQWPYFEIGASKLRDAFLLNAGHAPTIIGDGPRVCEARVEKEVDIDIGS